MWDGELGMANFAASKQDFANQMIATARALLNLADDLDNLNAAFSVHGFNSGGPNQFIDGDFTTNNTSLTAAIVNDVMFAIGTLDGNFTTGIRNSLRECIPGAIP